MSITSTAKNKHYWLVWRYSGQSVALVVAVIGAANYSGLKVLDCGWQCGATRNLWYSPFLTFMSLVMPLVALVTLVRDPRPEFYLKLARAQGIMALIAFAIIASNRLSCVTCFSIQLFWIGLSLEAFKSRVLGGGGLAIFALGLASAASLAIDQLNEAKQLPVTFYSRSYEPRLYGKAIVIFTDPLDTACRSAHHKFTPTNMEEPVVYRWRILPQRGDFALRIACSVESAKEHNRESGLVFFEAVYRDPPPKTEADVIERGRESGIAENLVKAWINDPEEVSLQTVLQDGRIADGLKITSGPSVARARVAAGGPPILTKMERQELRANLAYPEYAWMENLSVFFEPERP